MRGCKKLSEKIFRSLFFAERGGQDFLTRWIESYRQWSRRMYCTKISRIGQSAASLPISNFGFVSFCDSTWVVFAVWKGQNIQGTCFNFDTFTKYCDSRSLNCVDMKIPIPLIRVWLKLNLKLSHGKGCKFPSRKHIWTNCARFWRLTEKFYLRASRRTDIRSLSSNTKY